MTQQANQKEQHVSTLHLTVRYADELRARVEELRDLYADDVAATDLEPYKTADGHEVSGTVHGIHILDGESGAAALTHDRSAAIAAISIFYAQTSGGVFTDYLDFDYTSGWLRYEQRGDEEWVLTADAKHPDARPATWITL